MIHTPPSSWRSMADLVETNRANTSAPSLTSTETIFDTAASSRGSAPRRK